MPPTDRQDARHGERVAHRRRLRRYLRLRDRRVRYWTALVFGALTATAAVLLVQFVSVLRVPGPPPVPARGIAEDGCSPTQIFSLDSWQLLRVDRPPVETPQKRLWEKALGDPAAAQPALRARLNGWPRRLLVNRRTLPADDRDFAWRLAKDTWRGLDALTDREHGLPLDTVRFGVDSVEVKQSRIGDYTNITDVGLYLVSVIAARDLGLLSDADALARLKRTFDTLEKLETDAGAFFNYYDTTSLERTSHFISFVDTGWLTTGLMVVRMAAPELYDRATLLIEQTDYRPFYDDAAGLMSHGYYVEPRAPSRYHYGVLYTEARLGTLIAIGLGAAPASVWFDMVRTFPPACGWQTLDPVDVQAKTVLGHEFSAGYYQWRGLRYVPSWGGSMFEALMPALVLDEQTLAPRSLGINGLAHAVGQRRFARRDLGLPVWGFSPSAMPGTEQYGEYGVRMLGSLGYAPGPVTPHASALALTVIPKAALANLRELARLYDVYGDFGLYDAVDPATGRVAYKYLALDQAMIFIALANHLTDHAIQRYFAADPIMLRAAPLIGVENFFK